MVKGWAVKASKRVGDEPQTWVGYKMEAGGMEVWERLGVEEEWRLRRCGGVEDQVPCVWSGKPFAVKRTQLAAYVAKLWEGEGRMGEREKPERAVQGVDSLSSSSSSSLPPARAGKEAARLESEGIEEVEEGEGWFPQGLTWEWMATAQIFPIKRIPKRLRLLWADVLVKALRNVLDDPGDDRRWRIMFALPKLCLRLPLRGGRKKRKAFEAEPFILKQLEMAKAGRWWDLWEEARQSVKVRKRQPDELSSAVEVRGRVMALIEEGRYSKAVQALDSAGIHRLDQHIVDVLKSKHPIGKGLPEPDGGISGDCAQFDTEEVLRALASFPVGTAPGGSRLRASYLQDAMNIPAGDADGRLSCALTGVVNLLARGVAPEGSAAWIAGAPVYPLRKKDGGVRPIAVGEVIRRLVAKCFCARFRGRGEQTFVAVGQVGVGVKGGAEAVVSAVREAVHRGNGSCCVLKVDLENAFNAVDREAVLRAVKQFFPEAEAWYRLCYGEPANLLCEGKVLPFGSAQGVQQGDPLGPLLFALGLRETCRNLKENLSAKALSVWYLDDGAVVGELKEIGKAWKIIQEEAQKVGLRVNKGKCELFRPGDCDEAVPTELRGIPLAQGTGFELLGAPVGDSEFCEEYVSKRIAKIEAALKRLEVIDDPQSELLLIRSCLGFPKFVFALRSAPPEDITKSIRKFDAMISAILQERLGILLSGGQEAQVHMAVDTGGLGVERAEDVAECAYLGNVLATRKLVGTLLGEEELRVEELRGVRNAFEAWKSKAEVEVKDIEELLRRDEMKSRDGTLHPQRTLAAAVHQRSWVNLVDRAPSVREQLRLRAVAREGAGAWWNLPPVKQLGFKVDRDEFLALVKWWLGVPMYAEHDGEPLVCPECGEGMDALGDHAVMCKHGPSRTGRHDGVNKTWAFALKGAGLDR